jgi:predicted nucleic acid-binding protein
MAGVRNQRVGQCRGGARRPRATADPTIEQRAMAVMAALHLVKIDNDILRHAARLEPRTLRSIDAVHLASALSLGDDLGAMVVYDSALAAAATEAGLQVLAPRT